MTSTGVRPSVPNRYVVPFSVSGGIVSVSRLADHLTALVGRGDIVAWHPGNGVGWPHTVIDIVFDSQNDADFARANCTDKTGQSSSPAFAAVIAP